MRHTSLANDRTIRMWTRAVLECPELTTQLRGEWLQD